MINNSDYRLEFKTLYINVSFPAFAMPNLFLNFECTSPKVENTLSTPAVDADAESSCLQNNHIDS